MSNSFTRLHVHLVWTTWDRQRLLDPKSARRVYGRLTSICSTLGCAAIAIGGMEDHVHLLVSLHPSISVAELVRSLKVGTTAFARGILRCPEFAWQVGYGAFTLRPDEREVVARYIAQQEVHHTTLTLIDEFERVPCHTAKAV